MRALKVCFLVPRLGRGGAEQQLTYLAPELVRRGMLIRVHTMMDGDAHVEEMRECGVVVNEYGCTRRMTDISNLPRIANALRLNDMDVICAFNVPAILCARLYAWVKRETIFVASFRNEYSSRRIIWPALRVTRSIDRVTVVNSRKIATTLIMRGFVDPEKCRVIPNAVDVRRFKPRPEAKQHIRQRLGIVDNRFLWLSVGRLEKQKGYELLVTAAKRVLQGDRGVLLIAGSGPEEDKLKEMAAQVGCTRRNVRFLGRRDDVPELMSAADALVLASAWEGMPNVLLEAAAAEVPVVATDVGGVSEVVNDGRTGILVKERGHASLAAAMEELMRLSAGVRRRMGEEARRKMMDNNSVERMATSWEEVLFHAVALRGRIE